MSYESNPGPQLVGGRTQQESRFHPWHSGRSNGGGGGHSPCGQLCPAASCPGQAASPPRPPLLLGTGAVRMLTSRITVRSRLGHEVRHDTW